MIVIRVDMSVDTVKETYWVRRYLWINLFAGGWVLTRLINFQYQANLMTTRAKANKTSTVRKAKQR